ncbi:MAG: hypothetical protein WCS37_00610 [Chloroflexota bacterium]|nr:hypothetical protein [Chloroflexota bacterium]
MLAIMVITLFSGILFTIPFLLSLAIKNRVKRVRIRLIVEVALFVVTWFTISVLCDQRVNELLHQNSYSLSSGDRLALSYVEAFALWGHILLVIEFCIYLIIEGIASSVTSLRNEEE